MGSLILRLEKVAWGRNEPYDVLIIKREAEFVDSSGIGAITAGYGQKYTQAMKALGMNPCWTERLSPGARHLAQVPGLGGAVRQRPTERIQIYQRGDKMREQPMTRGNSALHQ